MPAESQRPGSSASSPLGEIRLKRYDLTGKLARIDSTWGSVRTEDAPESATAPSGESGFYAEVRFGLWSRKTLGCAIYLQAGAARLRIGRDEWMLGDGPDVRWEVSWPFTRRWRVETRDGPSFDGTYWYVRSEEWPNEDDFPRYVTRIAGDPVRLARFVEFWTLQKAG